MFRKLLSANPARIGRFDGTPSDLKADLIALPAGQLADGFRYATGRPYESFLYLLEELSRPEAN